MNSKHIICMLNVSKCSLCYKCNYTSVSVFAFLSIQIEKRKQYPNWTIWRTVMKNIRQLFQARIKHSKDSAWTKCLGKLQFFTSNKFVVPFSFLLHLNLITLLLYSGTCVSFGLTYFILGNMIQQILNAVWQMHYSILYGFAMQTCCKRSHHRFWITKKNVLSEMFAFAVSLKRQIMKLISPTTSISLLFIKATAPISDNMLHLYTINVCSTSNNIYHHWVDWWRLKIQTSQIINNLTVVYCRVYWQY